MPSVTVNDYGKGKAYYIATRQNINDLQKIVLSVAQNADIKKIMQDNVPDSVRVTCRTDGEYDYIFVLNFATSDRNVLIGDKECENLLDGKTYKNEITLQSYGVAVLKRKI